MSTLWYLAYTDPNKPPTSRSHWRWTCPIPKNCQQYEWVGFSPTTYLNLDQLEAVLARIKAHPTPVYLVADTGWQELVDRPWVRRQARRTIRHEAQLLAESHRFFHAIIQSSKEGIQ